jgi:tetraprenyl-beta-curcumene synthase
MQPVAADSRVRHGRELIAFICVMARFWFAVFPLVRSQLRRWERAAEAIPDTVLRAQALATLRSERLSAAGAALFAVTTRGCRHPALVRTLVAFQVICDYLDTLAEQPAADPITNGMRLHRALADAVTAAPPRRDWYAYHCARDDGGYLASLVETCREGCAALPAFEHIRAAAEREARRNAVQGINHAPAEVREPALRQWAAQLSEEEVGDAQWFELAAASSSSLAVLALIAAAADPHTTASTAERVCRAYFPWIEALSTLLDSFVDYERDLRTGEMSFVAGYGSMAASVARLQELTARAIAAARALPHGERHVVLVTGMIAMHLSEATAWLPATEPATAAIMRASRTAAMPLLMQLLRTWRGLRALRGHGSEVFSSE